jgi:hypothetical protein
LRVTAANVAFEAYILFRDVSNHMELAFFFTGPTTGAIVFIDDFGSGFLINVDGLNRAD